MITSCTQDIMVAQSSRYIYNKHSLIFQIIAADNRFLISDISYSVSHSNVKIILIFNIVKILILFRLLIQPY